MTEHQKDVIASALEVHQSQVAQTVRTAQTVDEARSALAQYEDIKSVLAWVREQEAQ